MPLELREMKRPKDPQLQSHRRSSAHQYYEYQSQQPHPLSYQAVTSASPSFTMMAAITDKPISDAYQNQELAHARNVLNSMSSQEKNRLPLYRPGPNMRYLPRNHDAHLSYQPCGTDGTLSKFEDMFENLVTLDYNTYLQREQSYSFSSSVSFSPNVERANDISSHSPPEKMMKAVVRDDRDCRKTAEEFNELPGVAPVEEEEEKEQKGDEYPAAPFLKTAEAFPSEVQMTDDGLSSGRHSAVSANSSEATSISASSSAAVLLESPDLCNSNAAQEKHETDAFQTDFLDQFMTTFGHPGVE